MVKHSTSFQNQNSSSKNNILEKLSIVLREHYSCSAGDGKLSRPHQIKESGEVVVIGRNRECETSKTKDHRIRDPNVEEK